jgi:hypothetical protein
MSVKLGAQFSRGDRTSRKGICRSRDDPRGDPARVAPVTAQVEALRQGLKL